jgi:N-acetylglucosaminyl-diphospho-decaprenol L-rhamnosyltransferase
VLTIDNPLISLIIVTYNSAALLPECLAAIASTIYPNYEVLVVDNASSDGTPQLVAERYPQVRLLPNSANIGFGPACNRGVLAANGELLVFLNPDVVVTPDWLSILARHMAEQPDAGIICPQTLYPDQSLPNAPAPVADTATVPGCAMLVRRSAWQQLGGFDERYFLYWEDTDMCWRAWLLGWRVLEDFEAYVYHERGGSAASQRWDAELTKNGLRTYLKTMRWRRAVPFAVLLAFNTMAKILLLGQRDLLGAWGWNWRHLGETMARRREIRRARHGDPAELERRIAAHERRGRRERKERRKDRFQAKTSTS